MYREHNPKIHDFILHLAAIKKFSSFFHEHFSDSNSHLFSHSVNSIDRLGMELSTYDSFMPSLILFTTFRKFSRTNFSPDVLLDSVHVDDWIHCYAQNICITFKFADRIRNLVG